MLWAKLTLPAKRSNTFTIDRDRRFFTSKRPLSTSKNHFSREMPDHPSRNRDRAATMQGGRAQREIALSRNLQCSSATSLSFIVRTGVVCNKRRSRRKAQRVQCKARELSALRGEGGSPGSPEDRATRPTSNPLGGGGGAVVCVGRPDHNPSQIETPTPNGKFNLPR